MTLHIVDVCLICLIDITYLLTYLLTGQKKFCTQHIWYDRSCRTVLCVKT